MIRWQRLLITAAALWCGLSVALGAFGAHGLKSHLAETKPPMEAAETLKNWETAARYHLVHGLAAWSVLALAVGLRSRTALGQQAACWSAILFLVGSLIFAGCLYAMVLGGPRILGAVVPIGGTAMIAGWVLAAVAGWRLVGGLPAGNE